MEVQLVLRIDDLSATEWNLLAGGDNPFVEHAFLALLEVSGSVGGRSGWLPRHLVVRDERGLVGALPCYRRTDSYGEFIFDWGWAQAAARAGMNWYPKLTCAVPFTPATGPRLLVRPGADREAVHAALCAGLRDLARDEGCSSTHILFCLDDEATVLARAGHDRRASLQFHWRNGGWSSFDEFLHALRHEDRKQIRRERRRVTEAGLDIALLSGSEVPPSLWPRIYDLYTSTSARKWGRPYLTRAFFDELPRLLGHRALVALARRSSELIAMTLSFEKGPHIYGRYWGTSEEVPGLHFELCYYQLIERALAMGATLVEAGAQGEHKLKRGFLPVVTHSTHLIEDLRLQSAVRRFLTEEKKAIFDEQRALLEHSPFRDGAAPPQPLMAGIAAL